LYLQAADQQACLAQGWQGGQNAILDQSRDSEARFSH